jgi:hypothetical protein
MAYSSGDWKAQGQRAIAGWGLLATLQYVGGVTGMNMGRERVTDAPHLSADFCQDNGIHLPPHPSPPP